MRELSSNSHRFPTLRRIMGVMGIAVKVLVGLVLLLPMTAYVVGSLVAAADEPREHAPIILQEQTKSPDKPKQSPSEKPTHKPSDDKSDRGDDDESDDPEVITPSPSVFDDDDEDDEDHSGPGGGGDDGGDDNSGKGSGDD
jgi:hypothetical protein